jgi:peptidoglycan/LPS O-acetylase OafA/YrhL
VKRDWRCFQPLIICRLVLPRLLQNCAFVIGWLLLSLALLQAVMWFFWCPQSSDGGVLEAKATYSTMLGVPPFLLGSACFLFLSRKTNPLWVRRLYWISFGAALVVCLTAFKHLCDMERMEGWAIVLGGLE